MMELSICIGSACHVKGSYNVLQVFQQMIEEYALHDKIELKGSFCMKKCECTGVGISVDGISYHVLPETARQFFQSTVMPLLE